MMKGKKRPPCEAATTDVPFIICNRRKNRPKIAPLVCEKRCKHRSRCPDFYDYIQPALFDRYERRRRAEKD
jgi:hypothetical protein